MMPFYVVRSDLWPDGTDCNIEELDDFDLEHCEDEILSGPHDTFEAAEEAARKIK